MPSSLSPAAGIRDILRGVSGFTTGWQIATGRFTAAPDQQLVVKHTGGRAVETAVAMDYPSVQLACRGTKGPGGYDTTYQKLRSAREALIMIPGDGIANAAYPELTSCIAIGDIVDMGYDDSDRPWFVQNLQLITTFESSGYRDAL